MVEQPIRNRQVESSTLSLGSRYLLVLHGVFRRGRALARTREAKRLKTSLGGFEFGETAAFLLD